MGKKHVFCYVLSYFYVRTREAKLARPKPNFKSSFGPNVRPCAQCKLTKTNLEDFFRQPKVGLIWRTQCTLTDTTLDQQALNISSI